VTKVLLKGERNVLGTLEQGLPPVGSREDRRGVGGGRRRRQGEHQDQRVHPEGQVLAEGAEVLVASPARQDDGAHRGQSGRRQRRAGLGARRADQSC